MGKCLIIKGADFSSVSAEHITIEDPRVVITVVASPAGGGTTTGTGSYDVGDSVIITATPAEGYVFSRWDDGNTNPSRTIIVGASAETYTAIFEVELELIYTGTQQYLNSSGVVTALASDIYRVRFYRVASTVELVNVASSKVGVGGTGILNWAVYSGINDSNQGSGFITGGNVAIGEALNADVDTSQYKILGVSDNTSSQYVGITVSVAE